MTDEKNIEVNKEDHEKKQLSRLGFLKALGTVLGGTIALTACEPETAEETGLSETPLPNSEQYPQVPGPEAGPPPGVMGFFTPHEALTVEALTATIFPGTPADPGAREAGVVNYIDATLSIDQGYAQRTYVMPPYGVAYEGDDPPVDQTPEGLEVLWVPEEVFGRYGWQSMITPREMYRMGVMMVDAHCQEQYGMDFISLDEAQQEEVVGRMADDDIDSFGPAASQDFFETLRNHVIEGMFGDPAYRGNRDMVGWKLIGYPGAQRAYTPEDMHTKTYYREPQSLADLPVFNPGSPSHPNVILPVTGSGTPGPETNQSEREDN